MNSTGLSAQHTKPEDLSSASDNVYMMTELNCPVENCDYSTDTNRGLAIHASSKHPDIEYDFTNRKEYNCPQCGDTFKDYESRRESKDSDNHFCSKRCKDSFEARDGLDTECTECGSDIHVPPSHIEEVDGYEQKNYFCDKNCESLFKSREWIGKDHPSWDGGREQVTCEKCGGTYKVHPNQLEETKFCSMKCHRENWRKDEQKYECVNCGDTIMKMPHEVKGDVTTCSKECFSQYMSSIRRGEDNPQWEGGRFEYYGPNWPEQRRAAIERDDSMCQECGMTMDEHIQRHGEGLHVHHKVPRRQIIDEENPTIEQFELANSLDNLVVACNSCHRKLESGGEIDNDVT